MLKVVRDTNIYERNYIDNLTCLIVMGKTYYYLIIFFSCSINSTMKGLEIRKHTRDGINRAVNV